MINRISGSGSTGGHHSATDSYKNSLGAIIARRATPVIATGGLLLSGFAHGATLTVDNARDPGMAGDAACSLREALASVNAEIVDPDCPISDSRLGTNDMIEFDARLSGEFIELDGSALVVEASVGIFGPVREEPDELVISAQGLSRVFQVVGNGIEVTIDSLTLVEGMTSGAGGAVLVAAPGSGGGAVTTLSNCVISDSTAGTNGGGAGAANSDSLTVDNCDIVDNTASLLGGALYASAFGTLSVYNSEIMSNESGGAAVHGGSNSVVVTIADTTIRNNSASSGNGGGVFISGSSSTLSISDSTIRNNDGRGVETSFFSALDMLRSTVSGHVNTTGGGAGIFLGASGSITDSTISGNTTNSSGGGIRVDEDARLTLTNSTVANNSAGLSGGGIFVDRASSGAQITRSTIHGNTADDNGGGLVVNDTVMLFNSTVSGNSANDRGGGIAADISVDALYLDFSTIASNTGVNGSNLAVLLSVGPQTTISASLIVSGQGADNCSIPPSIVASNSLSDDDSCHGFTEDAAASSRLGALTDNGGPTLTHALFQGNPAIDAVDQVFCIDDPDQRGFFRPRNGSDAGAPGCDIGAVEFTDTDSDGVIDFYEANNGLDPNDPNDPNGGDDDLDGDGATNKEEFEAGSAANNPDTDGDILGDAIDADPANDSNACIQDGLGDAEFNITAMAGMTTQCAAENSVTVRGTAIIEGGAVLQLYSPNIGFDPQVGVPIGAQVEGNAVDPLPGAAPYTP